MRDLGWVFRLIGKAENIRKLRQRGLLLKII